MCMYSPGVQQLPTNKMILSDMILPLNEREREREKEKRIASHDVFSCVLCSCIKTGDNCR